MERKIIYSSIDSNNMIGKMKVFSYMKNTEAIADHLDETIHVKDIIMEQLEDEKIRTIVIDESKSYGTTSKSIQEDLQEIMQQFGEPNTWEMALPLKFIKDKTKKYSFYKVMVDINAIG